MSPSVRVFVLLVALPLFGTVSFMIVEGWNFFDALYMAVITLTTVGYDEVHELSDYGRAVVMLYLVVGLGVFIYSATHVGELVIRGELRRTLGRRQMKSAMKSLRDHDIVCGFGRMGMELCRELATKGRPFVVIDRDNPGLDAARDEGWTILCGDATDDRTLRLAGIDRARGLAAVLSSDADNLYVVLSARLLNRNLKILGRATDEKSVVKMERAGADRVVSIYNIGATKMAQLLTNPNLVDFIEILATRDQEFDIAQITVSEDAAYCNRTLAESDLRDRGISVVAIRKRDGEFSLLPPGSSRLEAEDTMTAIGDSEAMQEFIATTGD